MQYIGGLLHSEDINPDDIRNQLEILLKPGKQATQKLHQIEALRDRLISGDNELLQRLNQECADLDIQQLRQLIRNAQKERAHNLPPRSYRRLFQMLNTLDLKQITF